MKFFDSIHCKSRSHCKACRNDAAWRDSLFKAGLTDSKDFECPYGIKEGIGLGDLVAKAANPIAGIIDKIVGTKLKGCGGCKQRQETLNKIKI